MSKHCYALRVAYNGAGLHGWQVQKGQTVSTVQGLLDLALIKLGGGESLAAGRTDAGVHARNHLVGLKLNRNLDPDALVRALNSQLDSRVRILSAVRVGPDFHPIRDSFLKEYRYYFYCSRYPRPMLQGQFGQCRYPLRFDILGECVSRFLGRHDFGAYSSAGGEDPNTVKSLETLEFRPDISFHPSDQETPIHLLLIRGDGFLKQMVRMIVGHCWDIARGHLEIDSIEQAFQAGTQGRGATGICAPPDGLYLWDVWAKTPSGAPL